MRLFVAFVAYELRTQARSLRFRLLAAAYLILTTFPAFIVFAQSRTGQTAFGPATYAAEVLVLLKIGTAVLATLLALDGIQRERGDGVWTVLTMAPMTNAGYLLRRWGALLTLLLPLSLVPLAIGAALAAYAGTPPVSAAPFLYPWLLEIAPLAVASSAAALGVGTIVDNGVAAIIVLMLLLLLVPGAINNVLARTGRVINPPGGWLGYGEVGRQNQYLRASMRQGSSIFATFLPATEGDYDPRAALEMDGNAAVFPLGLALAALAVSGRFLRRGRPDLAPWKPPAEHPLRSFLAAANRGRQRYAPDPTPGRADRFLLFFGLLALGTAGTVYAVRQGSYRALAGERFTTERDGWPKATPAGLVAERWQVEAEIGAAGTVRSRVDAGLLNASGAAASQLGFDLNSGLRVTGVTAGRGRATARQRWDRLELRLDPPLAPGERRSLHFELAGAPQTVLFALQGGWGVPFQLLYARFANSRIAANLSDLSASWRAGRISPHQIDLEGRDLFPVPRYTPWELTKPGEDESTPGHAVPDEAIFPLADLRYSIRVPDGLFLAESCGKVVLGGDSGRILRGRCTRALGRWRLFGGRRTVERFGEVRLAVLPQHVARARFHAPALAALGRQVADAWPGFTIDAPIFVEASPPFSDDPFAQMSPWSFDDTPGREAEASGSLFLLPERTLVLNRKLSSSRLAAATVSEALLAQREVALDEQAAFRVLFDELSLRRLGLGSPSGAALSGRGFEIGLMEIPILPFGAWYDRRPTQRVAAVVAYLDRIVGAANVKRGVEAFLARRGDAAGTMKELFDDLSAAGGVTLDRLYKEFVIGPSLPQLTLDRVRVERGELFRVTGVVANRGTGLADCPVVVSTESGPIEGRVQVDGGSEAPFVVATRLPPRSVQLDPNRECLRFEQAGAGPLISRVDLSGKAQR